MKHVVMYCLILTLFLCTPLTALAQRTTGNVNFLVGTRTLHEDDWSPLEDQSEFGVTVDFRPSGWPVNLTMECGSATSEESRFGITLEARTLELDVGVKKIFENSSIVNPFIAGGLAVVNIEASGDFWGFFDLEDDTTDIGAWVSGGVFLTLSNHFNIGVQAKYTEATTDWYGRDRDLGGPHVGGFIGYHW
jgi:hypothetical protein